MKQYMQDKGWYWYKHWLLPVNGCCADPVTGFCPSSERIMPSMKKCFGENIDKIVEYKGILVPNLVRRNGDRVMTCVDRRGGKREKTS